MNALLTYFITLLIPLIGGAICCYIADYIMANSSINNIRML